MRSCRTCQKYFQDDARFCPHCGTSAIEETITCPACGEENDMLAKFCYRCGFGFFSEEKEAPKSSYRKTFEEKKQAPKASREDLFSKKEEAPKAKKEEVFSQKQEAPKTKKEDVFSQKEEAPKTKKEEVFSQKEEAPKTKKEDVFNQKKEAPEQGFNDIFDTSHIRKIEQEIADRFSLAFERRLKEEHSHSLHDYYIDRFYLSDFRKSADVRIQQLAEDVRRMEGKNAQPEKEKSALLNKTFEELIDYFIIRHCADLNETVLPEAILKYQHISPDKVNLHKMVSDFLNFEREDASIYTDFITMPAHKLKNAAQSFLFPKKGELIFFICDLSVLGSCKEGFAMTNECIYWKAMLEKPQRVFYKNLDDIKRQESWLTINGIFFTAGKSFDLKLLRLLKKLRSLFGKQREPVS